MMDRWVKGIKVPFSTEKFPLPYAGGVLSFGGISPRCADDGASCSRKASHHFPNNRMPTVEGFGEEEVQRLSDLAAELISLLAEELFFESEVSVCEGPTLLLASMAKGLGLPFDRLLSCRESFGAG